MLTCSRCQTENQDDARLCRECGNPLPTQGLAQADSPGPEAPRSAPAACPSCGEPAPADSQFCSSCGKTLIAIEYAGFWRRFGGFLIDGIILAGIGAITGLVLSSNASSLIGLVIGISYYVGLNANGGTLGKQIVGLRLQDARTGENIGYPRALIRYIVAIASALALLIGYLWCIWDGKKQTWQDKAAGSVVVST